jgi:hypothetical protein
MTITLPYFLPLPILLGYQHISPQPLSRAVEAWGLSREAIRDSVSLRGGRDA